MLAQTDKPDVEQIEALLANKKRGLVLPASLEAAYLQDHRRRAIATYHTSSLFILLLYFFVGSGIYIFLPPEELDHWVTFYCIVGLIIGADITLSHIRRFDDWFGYYVTIGSLGSVTILVALTGIVSGESVAGQLIQLAVLYCMIVIYCVVGLTFRQATYAGWLGGAAGLALIWAMNGKIDWNLFHRSFTGGSLLGMFLAYYSELRDRESFLQNLLLKARHEVTEEYAMRMSRLSRQDALTGLANRRQFDEIIIEEWRRATRQNSSVAVLMIDIDHFKHYNDALGHASGDGCLRKVASIIAAQARRPGELAARYGGEEFVLFYPETGKAEACRHAERLVRAFRQAGIPQAPGLDYDVLSVSVGVAVTVPGVLMLKPDELVCAADDALYEAKAHGRGHWRYAAGIEEQQKENRDHADNAENDAAP